MESAGRRGRSLGRHGRFWLRLPKEWHIFGKRMPRSPNSLPTVTITVSTTPQIQKYLARLVATGLFGKNAAEAAERLIARSVEQLGRDGVLPRPRAPR
jgi:hypothetical protein